MNKIINKELIYDGKIIKVEKQTVILENNKQVTREFVHHKKAVAMVAILNDEIILVNQYRTGTNSIFTEIPAGLLEENEDPKDCANRELQEEIGFKANKLTFLGKYFLSPGFCDELLYIYLCEDLEIHKLPQDEDELITFTKVPLKNLKAYVFERMANENLALDIKTFFALNVVINKFNL